MTTQSVAVDCPEVLIPSADDLEKIIIFIGNKYGWEYIKPIEEILGAFPLSHTWPDDLDFPELEWEGKIQAIIEEFKLFPIVKIAEFLKVSLTVVVPHVQGRMSTPISKARASKPWSYRRK